MNPAHNFLPYFPKVKLSLWLTKCHDMKMYWGVEVKLHVFLTSTLDGGEWSASNSGRFIPEERPARNPLDRRLALQGLVYNKYS
jgi:hypothetical protein